MRVVLQRVRSAQVAVAGEIVGSIQRGYLLLVGLAVTDDAATVRRLSQDICKVRLMEDAAGKFGLDLKDGGGELLAVSQFTLLAHFAKGNRPSFDAAAPAELARPLFELLVQELGTRLGQPIQTGKFGANMQVTLVNDGPVTIVLE